MLQATDNTCGRPGFESTIQSKDSLFPPWKKIETLHFPIILPLGQSRGLSLCLCTANNQTIAASAPLIFCNVHHSLQGFLMGWLAEVIFSPQRCSRPPTGPLHAMRRSACWSWDWLLSFLELCQVQLHPPQAPLNILKQPTDYLCFVSDAVPVFGWLWPCKEIKTPSALC